jgi:hypothetical protein
MAPSGISLAIVSVLLLFVGAPAEAQSLPSPSRTVFKCKKDGKIVYSDSPCLGAEKLDVEPTRGLNAASGKERIGPDVQRELRRETMANGLRPITGLDPKQFETAGRRLHLSGEAQRECRDLDRVIPAVELKESRATGAALPPIQQQLFVLRTRYRELRC